MGYLGIHLSDMHTSFELLIFFRYVGKLLCSFRLYSCIFLNDLFSYLTFFRSGLCSAILKHSNVLQFNINVPKVVLVCFLVGMFLVFVH